MPSVDTQFKRQPVIDRFLRYVTIGSFDECWEWIGVINDRGYGRIVIDGVHRTAHTVGLELMGVVIPPGYVPDHLCRNRRCVNPFHLEVVPKGVNTLRGMGPSMVLHRAQQCAKGHSVIGANVQLIASKPNQRRCRICIKDRQRNWYNKHKTSIQARRKGKRAATRVPESTVAEQ